MMGHLEKRQGGSGARDRSLAPTTSQLMERIGFPADAEGPHVTALRHKLESKRLRGMVSHSVTWTRGGLDLPPDERARRLLAFDWEAQHYGYRVECIDGPPWRWRYSWPNGGDHTKRRLEIKWRRFPAWFRDHARRAATAVRRWGDKRILGVANPYLEATTSEPAQRQPSTQAEQ